MIGLFSYLNCLNPLLFIVGGPISILYMTWNKISEIRIKMDVFKNFKVCVLLERHPSYIYTFIIYVTIRRDGIHRYLCVLAVYYVYLKSSKWKLINFRDILCGPYIHICVCIYKGDTHIGMYMEVLLKCFCDHIIRAHVHNKYTTIYHKENDDFFCLRFCFCCC